MTASSGRAVRVILGGVDISQHVANVTVSQEDINVSTFGGRNYSVPGIKTIHIDVPRRDDMSAIGRAVLNDVVSNQIRGARASLNVVDEDRVVRAEELRAARDAAERMRSAYRGEDPFAVRDDVAREDGYVRWRGSGDAMTGSAKHAFVQDDAQAPARLCFHCDMWPEHHNHDRRDAGVPLGPCVCQECDPDGEHERDTSIYSE